MGKLILDTGILIAIDRGTVALPDVIADDEFRAIVPSIPYDDSVAERHAELLTYVRGTGSPRVAHDLIIAATARATGRTVVTTDKRADFGELPGVDVRLVG